MLKKYQHYINGQFVDPNSKEWFKSTNPYTGEDWAEIARGNASDVDKAVKAASVAFESSDWRSMTASKRGRLLVKLADLIEENAERLAVFEVRDNGKLMAEMHSQLKYIPEWFRYYGGLADKIEGAVIPTDKTNVFNYTKHEPLGVVAAITAWNSPLLLLTWKLAPLLAAGNTTVIKPSEYTSASTLEFVKLVKEAGFPDGVVNVVTGFGMDTGAPLVEHPLVNKVAFTGSDASGQHIYQSAAKGIKSVTLELGGKSPNIVFDDANIESAVMGAVSGIFAATGQTCIAGSRLLLQENIVVPFMQRLIEVTSSAKVGDPMSADTNIGPVTTEAQYNKILEYIKIAKAEGATCVFGGNAIENVGGKKGNFVEPTIFTNVNNKMRIAQEEVFGPILSVITFKDEQEAIAIANDSNYGLAAGVWTQDMARTMRMVDALKAGTVWVNTYRALSYTSPFGGYKRSGIGRESGIEAMSDYLQTKSVWLSTSSDNSNPFVMR